MRQTPTHALRSALLALVLVSCTSDGALGPDAVGGARGTIVSSSTTLVINEVMANPSGTEPANEWFEIYNAGPDTVNLKGWQVYSRVGTTGTNTETYPIAGDLLLPPGAYGVVARDTSTANLGAGAVIKAPYGTVQLANNNADWLELRTPGSGTIVDHVDWGSPGPTTDGISRELKNPALDNSVMTGSGLGANWQNGSTTFSPTRADKGTPGQPNVGFNGGNPNAGPVATVTVPSASLLVGATKQLTATAVDANGLTAGTTFTWASGNVAVATVSASGLVTAVGEGATTVTATAANGVSGSGTITVAVAGGVATISVSINTPRQAPVGFTKPAFATAKDLAGTTITPGPAYVWTTSDPTIATVDQLGYVTAVREGTVRVIATAPNGISGSTSFTVIPATAPTSAYYDNLEFGTPTDETPDDEFIDLQHPQYALSYNRNRGGPNWVSWNIDASDFGDAPRCDCFSPDATIPSSFYRVVDLDYRNGGYDRGHMVQSESRTATDQENAATFLLTNILPQAASNNQGPWSKFENYLNDLARDSAKQIYVVAGGIYGANAPTLKGEGHVAVPQFTWKVAVIMSGRQGLAQATSTSAVRVIAVKMPNLTGLHAKSGDSTFAGTKEETGSIYGNGWQMYETTVDAIEAASGYDLLAALPDDVERIVESKDRPPVASIGGPYSGDEGSTVTFDGSASSDPDANDALTYAWDFGDGTTGTGAKPTHVYADNNAAYVVTLTVKDKVGATATATTTAAIANVAPTATFTFPATLTEGSSIALSLVNAHDASSVDQAQLQFAFDCGDGAGFGSFSSANSASCPTSDDGTRAVRAQVRDKDGAVTPYSGSVSVQNAKPSITGLTFDTAPVSVGTAVTVSATFTDVGTSDTHLRTTITWDDGFLSAADVVESGGSGTATASRPFSQAGVYSFTITVTDDDGGATTQASGQYVVVYDPTAGFVTGGGWILSPGGACLDVGVCGSTAQGKASFGFVARYQRGATTPSGNTEFQFHEGGFAFSSTSYQWLVVAGEGRAQYKGTGVVAGRPGSYGFLLTAVDDPSGDRFRVKIWNAATNVVVYDNQQGSADDSFDGTAIGGGSIVVHAK